MPFLLMITFKVVFLYNFMEADIWQQLWYPTLNLNYEKLHFGIINIAIQTVVYLCLCREFLYLKHKTTTISRNQSQRNFASSIHHSAKCLETGNVSTGVSYTHTWLYSWPYLGFTICCSFALHKFFKLYPLLTPLQELVLDDDDTSEENRLLYAIENVSSACMTLQWLYGDFYKYCQVRYACLTCTYVLSD